MNRGLALDLHMIELEISEHFFYVIELILTIQGDQSAPIWGLS